MPHWNSAIALLFACAPAHLLAQATFDLTRARPQPGLNVSARNGALEVLWDGEAGHHHRAVFTIRDGRPLLADLATQTAGGAWKVLGANLQPEFRVTTGRRRTGHGLPEDQRWLVYWDAPLRVPGAKTGNPDLPRKPEEVRRFTATFASRRAAVDSDGTHLNITFDGLEMGVFRGSLRFTVYKGSSLMRQEAIATTQEPSLAYIYEGGLAGFPIDESSRLLWKDLGGNMQNFSLGGGVNEKPAPLRARNRIETLERGGASISVFPPPHQFFFARQLEINHGFVWYRKDANGVALGVRHSESHEGYNPTWIEQVWALFNAPPGTEQHMGFFWHLAPLPAPMARAAAVRYTRDDRYAPIDGYKAMATHFHTATTMGLLQSGSLDNQPDWIAPMRALGIDIAMIFDFHGDGHPLDPGEVRLQELSAYYEVARRHSDRDFLILPGEEANAYLGGHYNIVFPKPVLWTHRRSPGASFIEQHPKFGTVYHTATADDVFELMKREQGVVWQTHPRTKGSTGFPDEIREKDYFKHDLFLGGAFKALPVDLSESRLCEVRCFGTLDDMNNWGRPKYLVGEVDTYKKFHDYDLWGDFNINYIKLDRQPTPGDWSPVLNAMRAGNFNVSTGEILIRSFAITGSGDARFVEADVEWTFPPAFAEVVWGNGTRIERKTIPLRGEAAFGRRKLSLPWTAAGQKWVRFALWDVASNGAFTQPVHVR